jgi:hypothetical protein
MQGPVCPCKGLSTQVSASRGHYTLARASLPAAELVYPGVGMRPCGGQSTRARACMLMWEAVYPLGSQSTQARACMPMGGGGGGVTRARANMPCESQPTHVRASRWPPHACWGQGATCLRVPPTLRRMRTMLRPPPTPQLLCLAPSLTTFNSIGASWRRGKVLNICSVEGFCVNIHRFLFAQVASIRL